MARITTKHPDPTKEGTSIELEKYDRIRQAIHDVLDDQGECSFTELTEEVEDLLGREFEGSIPWYVTTVKLDLEARGELVCNRAGKRQLIRKKSIEEDN